MASGRRWTAVRNAGVATVTAATMAVTTGCGLLDTEPAEETVVIGVDLELTGDGSGLGAIYRDALELRVAQINEQGLLGDRRLELDIRDNRSDPGTAAVNVAELASDPSVAVVISGGCSACAVASSSAANDAGVPMIALAAADEVAEPVEERPFVFKLGPNATDNATVLAGQLNDAGVGQVAILAEVGAYGDSGVEELAGALDVVDIEHPVTTRVTGEEASVAAAVSEVVGYQPELAVPPPPGEEAEEELDAVVLWVSAPVAANVALGLRAGGYEDPLFLDAVAADELFLTGDEGAAMEGATIVFTEALVMDTVVATSPAKAARKTWFETYSSRFGTYHAFSSFAADAVQLVVEVVTRLGDADRAALRDGFERTQFDAVTGPLRITPDNHSGLTPLGLIPLVARGDRWQPATD